MFMTTLTLIRGAGPNGFFSKVIKVLFSHIITELADMFSLSLLAA